MGLTRCPCWWGPSGVGKGGRAEGYQGLEQGQGDYGGCRTSCGDDENVLKLVRADICTIL